MLDSLAMRWLFVMHFHSWAKEHCSRICEWYTLTSLTWRYTYTYIVKLNKNIYIYQHINNNQQQLRPQPIFCTSFILTLLHSVYVCNFRLFASCPISLLATLNTWSTFLILGLAYFYCDLTFDFIYIHISLFFRCYRFPFIYLSVKNECSSTKKHQIHIKSMH